MFRFRLLVVVVVFFVVGSGSPVLAQEVVGVGDAETPVPSGPVVVPEVGDVVVPAEGLDGLPGLPDADAGRVGFEFGSAVGVAGVDGVVGFGGLPVSVVVAEPSADAPAAGLPVSVSVVVADPSWVSLVSPDVGFGVQVDLFVAGNTVDVGGGSARVTVDYSGVELGYGAGLFERLTVLWVDDCGALGSGELVCGSQRPVPTQLDPRSRTLSFEVTDADLRESSEVGVAGAAALPSGLSGGPVRVWGYGDFGPGPGGWYVIGSTPDGPQGSSSAMPLSPVADYQVGLFSGALQVSYPISTPPGFHGPQPQVVFSYDSGAVDGLSGDRNTQSGPVGLGWSYHPGSITRVLAPCKTVVSNWESGDLCPTPGGEIFYLSLGGTSSRLVEVNPTTRTFRLESEQFWELQLHSGASNGDSEGEWWELRTPDGATYQFGREESSSYNSVQWSRVWVPGGGNPNEWCDDAVGVFCNKAYQWNLEKVTDRDGFFMEITYEEFTNWYFSAYTSLREYTRDAQPLSIAYGAGPGGMTHHARVIFTYEPRCFYPEDEECDTSNPQDFPDVPYDLECESGQYCGINGPSFWTDQRLASVQTEVYDHASAHDWVLVDQWVLTHGFPTIPKDPDNDEGLTKLWLVGIQRLGVSAWAGDVDSVDAPPTMFDFILLPNRLQYVGTQTPVAPQYMARISRIINAAYLEDEVVIDEHGVVEVVYGRSHDCARQGDGYDSVIGLDDWPFGDDDGNDIPGAWVPSNRRRPCDDFHRIDPADGGGNNPALFRKWKVMTVTRRGEGGNPDETVTYDWRLDDAQGNPTQTPMWRYQAHDYLGASKSFWNDYRGNRKVRVIDASGASTVYTFYQGMDGDEDHLDTPALVNTFSTSDEVSHTDYEYLVGQAAEVAGYDSAGEMLTRTLTDYWAADTSQGDGTWLVRPSEVTQTVFGSAVVTGSTEYTYDDDHGNPTLILHHGTAADDPLLEEIDWVQADNYPLMWLPKRRTLWDGATPGDRQDAQAVVEYLYDGATSITTPPTYGRLTKTRYYTVRAAASQDDEYVAYNIGYDATMHWPTTYTDPEGVVTGFAYNTDYGFVTSKTLDQGGAPLATTLEVHPARGLVLSSTDPNTQSDKFAYDELGRVVEYWNRTRAKGGSGSILYSYTNPGDGTAARVRERPLVGGNRLNSYVYYDGFGRVLQTQSPFDQDGDLTADDRTVVSVQYNTRGMTEYQSAPWVNTAGAAGAGLLTTTWSTQDSYTRTSYDALGRVAAVDAMSDGAELFDTETVYDTAGYYTTVTTTDPEGRWVTHYSNGFGQLVRVAEPNSLDTYYAYTPRGELETVTDDDSNVTSIGYDLLGRKLGMTDPDMGTWSYDYDDNSRLITQTDGRGTTLTFVYDDLGRMTQRKQGATVLAEWFYGTTATGNVKGRLIKTRINGNNSDAVVEYDSYDPDGNPTSMDYIIGGTSYDVDVTLFNGGAVEDVVYPLVPGAGSRETVTTSYDGLGQPFDLVGGKIYVHAAGWTAQGGPSVWSFDAYDTITRRWDYDPQTLRVTQLKAGTSQIAGTATVNLMRLEYSYDDSGNVTRILDYKNSSQYECYGYDTHNRLTDAFTGNSACTAYATTGYAPFDHDYGYDDLHNLTSLDGPTYSYGTGNEAGAGDAGPHAVVEIGTTIDFGYDDNGNRITKTVSGVTTGYTFNLENRLSAVDLPSAANDVVFVYDADGRRVKRSHGTYSTVYVAGLMEIDRTGSTVTETRTFYGFAGVAVAVRTHTNAATTFVFQNHLGSTVTAFNDTSNTHLKQYYYPYGAERYAVGSLPLDQRYTGQTSDATGAASAGTGLLYYNARYYDPAVGAFTSADSVVPTTALSVGLNHYAYVNNNPVNYTDPTGHTCEPTLDPGCDRRGTPPPSGEGAPVPIESASIGDLTGGAFRWGANWLAGAFDTVVVGVLNSPSILPGVDPLFPENGPIFPADGGYDQGRIGGTAINLVLAGYGLVRGVSGLVGLLRNGTVAPDAALALNGAMDDALELAGTGSGPIYGTRVHTQLANQIRALNRSDLFAEQSYLGGRTVKYGTPGSVRVDVVIGDRLHPSAIVDLKTGSAALSADQIALIRANLPPGYQDIPVIELHLVTSP